MLALAAVVFLFVGVGACIAVTVENERIRIPLRKEKVHREEEVSPLITRRTTSPARSDSPAWEMV